MSQKQEEKLLTFYTEKGFTELEEPILTKKQFNWIVEETPESEIEIKEDTDGFKYKTVKGSYIKKRLNLIFGFNWDFHVIDREYYSASSEVLVQGRLTIRLKKGSIIKEQFGKHYLKSQKTVSGNRTTTAPFNVGNAFKSAATDALKKCASEIGLCWDVYSQEMPESEEGMIENKTDHPQDKITERLEYFLKEQTTLEGIEKVVSNFEENEKLTEERKSLIEKYKSKLK